jgi:N-acetylneuraminic acid mutarotase
VDTNETVKTDLWEYSSTTDSWTQLADLPAIGRRSAFGFSMNGLGYLGGGVDADEAQLGNVLTDFWEYNPTANSWTAKAAFPGANNLGVYYATSFSIDNKGYVCGGKVGPNSYSDELWEYKPSINTWTQRSDFPGGIRYNLSSLVLGNEAYIGLGTDQDNYRSDWWQYNPGSNQWVQKTSFIGGQRGGASTFVIGENGYVCLGTNGALKDDLFMYDPNNNQWYPRANYGGSERKQAVSFIIGNRAFVGTGSGVSGKKASMYEYISLDELVLEEWDSQQVTVYPNPSNSIIIIDAGDKLISSIKIYNDAGMLQVDQLENTTQLELSISDLPSGSYHLYLEMENGRLIGHKSIQIID